MSQQPARRGRLAAVYTALAMTLLNVVAFARGQQPVDDRGSDSSEKAFMVILAITIGGAVTAAAVAFVATKTALFK